MKVKTKLTCHICRWFCKPSLKFLSASPIYIHLFILEPCYGALLETHVEELSDCLDDLHRLYWNLHKGLMCYKYILLSGLNRNSLREYTGHIMDLAGGGANSWSSYVTIGNILFQFIKWYWVVQRYNSIQINVLFSIQLFCFLSKKRNV